MLPFSPQLVHDWKTVSLMRIKYLNIFFLNFLPFFLVVVTLTELPALSILFAPAGKGTLIVMNLLTYF